MENYERKRYLKEHKEQKLKLREVRKKLKANMQHKPMLDLIIGENPQFTENDTEQYERE